MTDREWITDLVRAEVSREIDQKLKNGEAIHAYVEKISKDVSSKAVDSRLTPFYKHPTFLNVGATVIAIFAALGFTLVWSDLIRSPVQRFLQIDEKVSAAVQKRQYEAYIREFDLGTFVNLTILESDNCSKLGARYLVGADILIPRREVERFRSCIDLKLTTENTAVIPFIAEPNEEVEVEILLIAKRAPSLKDGYESDREKDSENDNFSVNRLLRSVAKGGEFLGRNVNTVGLIKARVDQTIVALQTADTTVPVRDAGTETILDSVRLWGRHKIAEKASQFHNLVVTLDSPGNAEADDMSFAATIFLERNKLLGNSAQ